MDYKVSDRFRQVWSDDSKCSILDRMVAFSSIIMELSPIFSRNYIYV